MSDKKKSPTKQIMIWVGSATAILTLIFGIQQLYVSIIANNKIKKEVRNLIQSSQVFVDSNEYNYAWDLLVKADQLGIMKADIEDAKVKTAFLWLRNMHANEKTGSFTEQTDQLLSTLSNASLTAKGEYLADIYAHMGWAEFLRLREGNFEVDPEVYYKKALAVDSMNIYANAMFGHWLYWQKKDTALGWQHFQVAANNGKDLRYVRSTQFFALKNYDYTNIEFLRLLYTMMINGETIEEYMAIHCLQVNYLGNGFERFSEALINGKIVKSSISPEEDLALFEWLCNSYPEFTESYQKYKPFVQAILTEALGNKMAASTIYKQLYFGLPDSNPTYYQIDKYLKNAINRTTSSK